MQLVGHPWSVPSQTYGAHDGLPGVDAPDVTHVPVLHVAHAPAQPVLQHTPSTQLPLPHWSAAVHDLPSACVPEQTPAAQLPLVHWFGSVQDEPSGSAGTHVPWLAPVGTLQ